MKLTRDNYVRTGAWLRRYARPLEMARWEYLFENGTKERVIRYLLAFQNEDGGFGHGLEPDFWLPSSSPMATWVASQILLEIGADFQDQIVQSLVSYLITTPQIVSGMWPSVLPDNNLHPHAPWWHWAEEVQGSWMYNPSVELAAVLVVWSPSESEGAELGWVSVAQAISYVMSVTSMERHEISNFRNCLSLLKPYEESFRLRTGYSFSQVAHKVQILTRDVIDQDIANWGTGYKPLPLDFIRHPDDSLYQALKPLVEHNLRFYVQQMSTEGVWDLSWSWEQYPEEFSIARRQWQGILAVARYKVFRAFGWME